MRFYRQCRTYRTWLSGIWGALLLFWISIPWAHENRHPCAIAGLGSYSLSPTSSTSGPPGRSRPPNSSRTPSASARATSSAKSTTSALIEAARTSLNKAIQIDYRGRSPMFITVDHKLDFEESPARRHHRTATRPTHHRTPRPLLLKGREMRAPCLTFETWNQALRTDTH